MAARAHVDDSVIERRLRPIYEWLDTGTNKKAVQEADKVLRKQPNLHCARVLKGLALLRMGRREACQGLIAAVVKEGPTDEATLQALTICYREMHQPEQICRVYEMAVKSEPGNEELLSHLFMAYVRVGDYKNQQQTAMKLYKLKPKNPYYFWAVMSHVMQAHKSGDPKGKEVSLLLAERMVNNFVKNNKIEAEAEVMTYLHILETQGKYEEALAVLDGPLASKVVHQPENFLSLKRASYHTHLGQWGEAARVYHTLIKQEPDNWQHYVEYIRGVSQLSQMEGAWEEDPLVEAATFLRGVQRQAVQDKTKDRGPLLGLLQLARVLRQLGLEHRTQELCGDIVDMLLLYIRGYGDKMCCYGDIVNFLPLVPKEKVPELLAKIRELCHLSEEGVPVDVEAVYRDLCWLQLRRALGEQEHLSSLQHLKFADSLIRLYKDTFHLSSNMADTDIRPGDAYLILATHSYLKAMARPATSNGPPPPVAVEGEEGEVVDAQQLAVRVAAILERGIEKTKANFQLKLLLIKVYNALGATGASQGVYDKCDMKHIQLDTLGHVLALQALDSANYGVATAVFSATLKFFMANYKDTSDPLISSYKYGSLTRIPEFVEFRERLGNSLHFATVTAEQMLLDLTTDVSSHSQLVEAVQQMDIQPATDKTNWDDLRDNRDLRVMNTWEPPHRCLQEEDIASSVKADIAMLRLRNLTLRLVGAACNLCHSSATNNQASANKENSGECVNGEACGCGSSGGEAEVLEELTTRLQEEYNTACASYSAPKPSQMPVQGPDPVRISVFVSGSYLPLLVRHAQVLHRVHRYTRDPAGGDSWPSEVVKEAREEVEGVISWHVQQLDTIHTQAAHITPGTNPPVLARLHHLAQSLGVVIIFLGCCVALLRPIKAHVAKRNKKKKEAATMPEVIPQLSSYLSTLTTHLQKLEKAISEKQRRVKAPNNPPEELPPELLSPLTGPEETRAVCDKIQESLAKSLERLASSIGNKVKYVSSLKL